MTTGKSLFAITLGILAAVSSNSSAKAQDAALDEMMKNGTLLGHYKTSAHAICKNPYYRCFLVSSKPDKVYVLILTETQWIYQQKNAESLGGKLATVTDSAVNQTMATQLAANVKNWGYIGYNDAAKEGTWVWEANDGTGYQNWLSGEPNNNDPNGENHAAIHIQGRWNDFMGGEKGYAFPAFVQLDVVK